MTPRNRFPGQGGGRAPLITAGLLLGVGLSLLTVACGGTSVVEVQPGTYEALVPTAEQFAADGTGAIPGGFGDLADTGIVRFRARVTSGEVAFDVDGVEDTSAPVTARINVGDREGSGPLRGTRQVLELDGSALRLGDLTIDSPVVWPGSYTGSPVITLKPHDPSERGPTVSCRSDESCLLLTLPPDPVGTYADANDPATKQNPLASVRITEDRVDFILDSGESFTVPGSPTVWSTACGIAETPMWEVPGELRLGFDDPVLVWTVCPTNPGAAIRLIMMERRSVPLLALTVDGSEWCEAGPRCLWFAPV